MGPLGIGSKACDPTEASFQTFDRLLMKLGEHTWGWNGGSVRSKSWSNAELQKSLATDGQFYTSPWTWIEQRMFINNVHPYHHAPMTLSPCPYLHDIAPFEPTCVLFMRWFQFPHEFFKYNSRNIGNVVQ